MQDAEAATPGNGGGFSAFRHRDFLLFWIAALLSNTGNWMQMVTVPFVLDQLTHSTAWVGVGAFCTYFPATIVGPWAGSLADRYSRRTVLLWAQSLAMLSAAALWAVWISGQATPELIVGIVMVGAVANGLTIAAWQAFVPQLVPPSDLVSAVRLNSMNFTGARAFGPALGGIVLATLGPAAAFLGNAFSFVAVIVALLMIRARPIGDEHQRAGVLAHFSEGIRYLRSRRVLVCATLGIGAVAFFGIALVQLAEPISRQLFDADTGQYGLVVAMYGVGAVTASILTVVRGDAIRRSTTTVVGLSSFVVLAVLLGLVPGYLAMVVIFVGMGASQVACTISCQTAVQVNVDEEYRGRVLSIYVLAFFAGTPVGALLAGLLAQGVGLQATIVVTGALFAVAVVVIGTRYSWWRPLDESLPEIHDAHVVEHGHPELGPVGSDLDNAGALVVEPLQ